MPFAKNYMYALKEEGGGGESSNKTVVIVVVVVVFSVVLAAGILCCLCVRKCAIEDRNQEVARRRILRDEMEEIPFRVSQVIHNPSPISPNPLNPPQPLFNISDIALHPLNRHYLQMGIPVGQRVHATTFQLEMNDEDWEWEGIAEQPLPLLLSRDSGLETTPINQCHNRPTYDNSSSV